MKDEYGIIKKNGIQRGCFLCIPNQRIKLWLIAMAKIIITKAYKFRIKTPYKQVQQKLENTLFLCRDLYNCAIQERRDAWKLNRVSISYYNQANQLPEIKKTNPEYKEVYAQVLQDVLRRVDKTFSNFFKLIKAKTKTSFPRFKGQNRFNSFTYSQSGFSLSGNKLQLSKIGFVTLCLDRPIQGKVKTLTIKKSCDKWFAIFNVETHCEPLPKTNQSIGMDAGISSFATLSDGTEIDNPRFAEKLQKKLRVAQRKVARRKKGSNRRRKAVMQLRKIYQKIKNARLDFHHKVARILVNNYDLIAIEDLRVKNMLKNHNLSRVISDVGWSAFFQILSDKVVETGRELIKVNPAYTSQKCSGCDEIVKKALSVRVHNCNKCGLKIGRDENAAINILTLALSVQAQT